MTTNTNLTTKKASYAGCGCAGGEVATLTDEGTIDGGVAKRRQQKIYSDILGRTVKTELLNWEGGSVYSTVVNDYNARDQVVSTRQYQGPDTSGVYHETTVTYDGYGRLKTKHLPEQAPGTSTTWDYNVDDVVAHVTDARGSVSHFNYNARHLLIGKTYDPSSGITDTPDVSFAYDDAGNQTAMTDGFGNKTYEYDPLSRLTSETRTITGVGAYPLSYAYNLAGELTSITDSFGTQVGYVYDTAGRVTSVTGANFADVPTYASNIQYRASGGLKHLDYGNTRTLSMTYNERLQPASFEVPGIMSKTYDYYADGQRRFSQDLANPTFDRWYAYDHAGRITEAFSGAEARHEGLTNSRPYRETFVYDAMGNLVERPSNNVWSGGGGSFSPSHQTYANNRNTAWQYDADGNLTDSVNVQYTVDAAGQSNRVISLTMLPFNPNSSVWGISNDLNRNLDGDGEVIAQVNTETARGSEEGDVTTTATTYFVRSTVLGGKVVTENNSETGQRGFVYLGQEVLAWQLKFGTTESVKWEHRDAQNASFRLTKNTGLSDNSEKAELDPLGTNAGTNDPNTPPSLKKLSLYPGFGASENSSDAQCNLNGILTPCSMVFRSMSIGAAGLCPSNNCGPRYRGGEWQFLSFTDDGMSYGKLGGVASNVRKRKPPTLKFLTKGDLAER